MPWEQNRRGPRGNITPAVRRRILNTHARICHICGHDDADQVDHIIPWSQGGTHDPENLAPAHQAPCPTCGRRCHREKTETERLTALRNSPRRNPRQRPPEPHPGAIT